MSSLRHNYPSLWISQMIQILQWINWGCVCPQQPLPLKLPIEYDSTDLNWTPQDFVALLCSVWLPDMALEETVGSSCWSWADPSACQGGKENLSEQLLISKLLHVCGRVPAAPGSSYVQAGEEGRCCWRQRNSRCVSEQPCCSAVSRGCFTHSLLWAALDAPTAGEGPLAPCAAPELRHFIISSCPWRFTAFCLGKCSMKTSRTTISYSDSCDTEVKKNTWVDSLEERYLCHLKTW